MAIVETVKNNKKMEEKNQKEQDKLQSDAISKLYKNKKQIDNSKNTKR